MAKIDKKKGKKWPKNGKNLHFSSIFDIFQILITFEKIFAESSLTPKIKDFVPLFQLKQPVKLSTAKFTESALENGSNFEKLK